MTILPEFLNVKQVAELTGLSEDYLNKQRMHKSVDGPPWFRAGRRCLYPVAGLRDWANARVAATTAGVR